MKKSNMFTMTMIFTIMIFAAVAENTKGIFIPIFKNDFRLSDTKVAFMLTFASIAYMTFTYLGGLFCQKIGQKRVFAGGFVFTSLSLFILSRCNSFTMLIVGMTIMNIGLALASIATNTIVPVLFLSYQAIIMNITHFCYGLGSTVGQRVTGKLVYSGVNWRSIYFVIGIVYIFIFIALMFINIPEPHKSNKLLNEGNNIPINKKLVILYIVALGTYVFAEMSTGNWFVNYMQKSFSFNTDKSSLYLALFYGIFTVGRLIGGFVVQKKGYFNTVLISLIFATILFTLGIMLKENGIIIISISGLFFSITFPTIVLSINKVFKERSFYITGIIITFSSATNMILNLLLGYLNDSIGVYKTFYIIPTSLLVSSIFVYILYKKTKTSLS